MEAANTGHPLLDVSNLSVRYLEAPRLSVNNISFTLGQGEQVAVVGESGSGKSTLSRAIAGFITETLGTVNFDRLSINGRDITQRSKSRLPYRVPGISMVFQDAMTSLDPVYKIEDQFLASLRGVERKATRKQLRKEIPGWLDAVGLRDTKRILEARPSQLSGGMRQRVMLALAMASRPQLLIADEPTSALDAELALEVMDLLATMTKESGVTLLIISHDIALCRHYCDRILVMLDGRLVDDCASDSILKPSRHPYTQALVRSVPDLSMFDWDVLPTIGARDLEEARAAVS